MTLEADLRDQITETGKTPDTIRSATFQSRGIALKIDAFGGWHAEGRGFFHSGPDNTTLRRWLDQINPR